VPVISFHGTTDLIVPYQSGSPFSYPIFPTVHGSAPIHQRLSNLGIMNELHAWEGIGHEPWLTEPRLIDTVFVHTPPFLYRIMQPQTSAISGDALVPIGALRTYSVNGLADSQFCWEVTGGTIVADNGSSVNVLWDAVGTWTISLVEVSCIEVLGEQQVLDVEVYLPTGLETAADHQISVSPNPTDADIMISGIPFSPVKAEVRAMDGRVVLSESIGVHNGTARLGMGGLSSGIYAVSLHTADWSARAMVVRSEH
jgi:hypothetical protein